MTICPACGESISNWSQAVGKIAKINGILYHIKCVAESTVKEIAQGKWEPIKSP